MEVSLSLQERKTITRLLNHLPMELNDFLTLYPPDTLSREELADIADCSIDVVDHWFVEPPNRRFPTKYHKLRFALFRLATDGEFQSEVLHKWRS